MDKRHLVLAGSGAARATVASSGAVWSAAFSPGLSPTVPVMRSTHGGGVHDTAADAVRDEGRGTKGADVP